MNFVWELLTHTPWWVFVIFGYLLKISISATRTRTILFKKLFILPLLFLSISLKTLFTSFLLSPLVIGSYSISLMVGIFLGFILAKSLNLKFDHDQNLVKMPGNYITPILLMAIFSAKYYLGYSLSTNPLAIENPSFIVFHMGVSGISSGLLLGRLACYIYRKSHESHQSLKQIR